ncbi:hypothetical protein AB0941_28340, partial [Streptomyces sp. NPDC013433]|uniref:hypothetical protein n=1 Tax=Streptomyces sp. NPDC013433 TaxID=3155604 RepID=UPI00345560FE
MSEPNKALDALVLALTGERLPRVDAGGALASREPLLGLARGLRELSGGVQSGIARVGAGLPGGVGDAYVSALR